MKFSITFAILVSMAYADYGNNYGSSIQKIVVYGKDKVVMPTMKNMMIVYDELLSQSVMYAPKVVRSEIEDLIYKINSFSVSKKKIIEQADRILDIIYKGYISDCDFSKQLEESMYIIKLLVNHSSDDYTYYYKKKL